MAAIVRLFLILNSIWLATAKVSVKKLVNCDPKVNYQGLYNFTFKPMGELQAIDGTFSYKAPLDNHIRSNVSVEMLVGTQYVYLFTINEKKSCEAIHKYFGEFWYDMERHAQLIPGLCPMPKGTYHLHNFLMDFQKMTTLSNFPFGHLLFTCRLFDNSNSIFTCILIEVENLI